MAEKFFFNQVTITSSSLELMLLLFTLSVSDVELDAYLNDDQTDLLSH